MTTINPKQAAALGYDSITGPIDPFDAQYARNIAADLERDHIPYAIVTLPNGCLQVWRKLGAQASTEHRRHTGARDGSSRIKSGRAQHQDRRAQHRARQTHPAGPDPISLTAGAPAAGAPHELIAQAIRLAATGNRYASTQLHGFQTIVLTTAVQEWEPLGFRAEFIRLIEAELKRRAEAARIGKSHLCAA